MHVPAVASQTWRHIDCQNKRTVEKSCVDTLFQLSELQDVESIEDHLYICPTTETSTTNISATSISADKACF